VHRPDAPRRDLATDRRPEARPGPPAPPPRRAAPPPPDATSPPTSDPRPAPAPAPILPKTGPTSILPPPPATPPAPVSRESPVYYVVDPGRLVRIADGRVTEILRDDVAVPRPPEGDNGAIWRLGTTPDGVPYALGFDRAYRIDGDRLVRVTRGKAQTNNGALDDFAPVADADIWASDPSTLVHWDGAAWHDLSPKPVADNGRDFDVTRQPVDLHVDRAGRVWVTTGRAVFIREGDVWRELAGPGLRPGGAEVIEFHADPEGVVHLELTSHAFVRVVPRDGPAGRDRITAAKPLPGAVWIDQDGARVTVVLPDGKRAHYTSGGDIPGRIVWTHAADARGRLWAATTAAFVVLGPGDARTVYPSGALPTLVGSPRALLVLGAGPDTLPPLVEPRRGGLRGSFVLDGAPLAGALVEICPHALMIQPRPCEGSDPTFATTTAADGSWQYPDIPLGDYSISVKVPEGWKLAHQCHMALGDDGMREATVRDLGACDVTGGMVAQIMPWNQKKRRKAP
jgi:hypothetical protein